MTDTFIKIGRFFTLQVFRVFFFPSFQRLIHRGIFIRKTPMRIERFIFLLFALPIVYTRRCGTLFYPIFNVVFFIHGQFSLRTEKRSCGRLNTKFFKSLGYLYLELHMTSLSVVSIYITAHYSSYIFLQGICIIMKQSTCSYVQ